MPGLDNPTKWFFSQASLKYYYWKEVSPLVQSWVWMTPHPPPKFNFFVSFAGLPPSPALFLVGHAPSHQTEKQPGGLHE